ncbi:ABC transporter ATP-binding protein [Candidatus Woesebacteria bacterium]|nr:ABC transporter ATP-binding protein [Candidatus Woesebacteria bacterium]
MKDLLKTIKVFYRFIARKRFWFGLFMFVTAISTVLYSIIPYFYKTFVDNLEAGTTERLFNVLLIYVGIRTLALITNTLAYYLGDIICFDAAINARKKVFNKLQELDFAFHTSKSTGSLISAIKRGDGALWSLFHAIHHRFLNVLIDFFVMLYFFNQIDSRITIFVSLSFLFAIFITAFLIRKNIKARSKHNEQEDKISGIIVDNLVNFETVKLFSREVWELKRLDRSFVPWLKYGWKYVNTFRQIDLSIGSIINISIFLIVFWAIGLIKEIALTTGEFVLILGFVNSFYPRLYELVWSFRDVGKNYSDVRKYFRILDYDVEIKDPEKPVKIENIKGEIDFRKVSFSYGEGKRDAIRNLNLRIREGQSVALVGRSGSGKTTLIKLLMRFFDVQKGKISIDDVDVRDVCKSHLRSFIGVVPQEPVLFNNTIEFNIGYGKDNLSKKELIAAAKMANLHRFVMTLPKKYKTQVGERGVKLSGGQKQRLAIARMILSDPDIVIFDEATSQLDSENEKMIQEAFWKATKNKTTIIIAHRLSTAMRADKIVVLEEGKIIEKGSHNSLLNKEDSLYKYLWDLQTAQI